MFNKMCVTQIVLVLCFASVILESIEAQCVSSYNGIGLVCKDIKKISREILNENYEDTLLFHIINTTEPLGLSAFKNMKNLIYLKISGGKIGIIFSNTFKDMPLLQEVDIESVRIEEIQESTFFNLPGLEKVTITNIDISFLRRGIFRNVPELSHISLRNSNLRYIESESFYEVPKLESLFLDKNLLTIVKKNMLYKLTNLNTLILAYNNISIIENNSFDHTPNLSILDLTNNQLKELDWNMFPTTGMKYLKGIYLYNNLLMYLPSNFFTRLPNLGKIFLNHNPWFCPCLRDIERTLYENNILELSLPKSSKLKWLAPEQPSPRIPICINKNVSDNICTNTYSEELSKKYSKYLKDYEDFF
ncbi:unnamed protein product [Psylliodes chrysocephalus]|uniref:Uncharacterized protein n=1 Tax=Psylliodes chrysocephalus TaxID=3402493 RepID=A0A9P0CXA5_9CUCU|nr:unnamed protein product [Psylliodes chrysocephala]